jgi:SpoVK/Ycf46/Vps4 family AAA+-type ATPase
MLSPGEFIARGLEYIEAESRSVFDRLLKLSRAVVLFDECDELFRERHPASGTEQLRGITAFVTASMLPKLQQLHDTGRVLFVICTNNFMSMDRAVTRPGRIDHIIGVGPPDRTARRRILDQIVSSRLNARLEASYLDRIASETERFSRAELERVVAGVLDRSGATDRETDQAIDSVVRESASSLAITEDAMKDFIEAKEAYSYPHVAARGGAA